MTRKSITVTVDQALREHLIEEAERWMKEKGLHLEQGDGTAINSSLSAHLVADFAMTAAADYHSAKGGGSTHQQWRLVYKWADLQSPTATRWHSEESAREAAGTYLDPEGSGLPEGMEWARLERRYVTPWEIVDEAKAKGGAS